MKADVYALSGTKKESINLPKVFDTPIREDIIAKCFEAGKFVQPYSPDRDAGRKHSASGIISHKRHDWKGHYGRGISRVPRKVMWRRGTQFFWIGAEISSTRGGRRAHGPKGIGKEKKINVKELKLAMNSSMAATVKKDVVASRYSSVEKVDLSLPVVIESPKGVIKAKEFSQFITKIFGDLSRLVFKNKTVRPGKGKIRGRKYKENAGLLLVTGSNEDLKVNRVEVVKVGDITIADLYPLGRLTIYTTEAIKELEGEKTK